MTRSADAGFSLIEALVAMTVLALGAVSLLSATEGHSARISAVIDRTAARWVAQNRLAELRLGLDTGSGQADMLGKVWQISTEITPTTEPALQRVTVNVGLVTDQSQDHLVSLNGYMDTGGAP